MAMEISQHELYLTRRFNCSVEILFEWMVKPELISQWFGPKHLQVIDVKTDLQKGGTYRIQLLKQDQTTFVIEGEYLEVKKPSKLAFTFIYRGISHTPPPSTVKITLESLEHNISQLVLIQRFDTIPPDMAERTKAWEHMMMLLAEKSAST